MLHTVGELKSEITSLLQGQTLSTVNGVNQAIERAARTTVQQADIPDASNITPVTLYGGVYYYNTPSTIFGGALNLIRRQGNAQTPWDYNYKVYIDEFSRGKKFNYNGYMIDFEYKNGASVMGISTPNTFPKAVIDPMNATDGWVAAGTASGLAQDLTNYYEMPASLRFTLTASGAGTLTKTLQNPNDWSGYQGVGVAFLAIQIPPNGVPANLTSISLKLGSSPSDYNEITETSGFLGAWVANDWLLVSYDFGDGSATTTGSPDWSAIDYVQVTLNHTTTMTNFHVGGLWLTLPVPHEMLFQSSALFLAAGSTSPLQTITSDGDTIILNDAGYNLFLHECALTIAMQQGGTLENGAVQQLRVVLYGDQGLYQMYRADNPSQELRTIGTYYDSWGGRGYYN